MNEKSKKGSIKKRIEELESELEKYKIRVQVFDELLKVNSTHVRDIEERIGELREGLTEREKEIRKIGVKVEVASNLVSQAKPQELMKKYEEYNSRLEVLQAKMDVYHNISEKVIAEIKDIRNEMSLFKGVKQILEMIDEVKEDIKLAKKIKAMVDQHAERTEKIYIEMEKKYKDFLKYKEMSSQLREQVKQLVKISKK